MSVKGGRDRTASKKLFNDNHDDIDWSDGKKWEPQIIEYHSAAKSELEIPEIVVRTSSSDRARMREKAQGVFEGQPKDGEKQITSREFMRHMKKTYGNKSVNNQLMGDLSGYNRALVAEGRANSDATNSKKSLSDWKMQMGELKMNKAMQEGRKIQRDIRTANGKTRLFKNGG